jgi:C4-dicarboxylate transporter, DctQ subunit
MGKLIDFICKLFAAVAGVLLIVVTVLIGYVILARAIHISSPPWVTQFTEYALLWITFLGTAWVLGRNRHIAIDLVMSQLGQRKKLAFNISHYLVGCVICLVLCYFSLLTVWSMFERGVVDVQVVDVAKYKVLLVIPLGFLLLALQFLRKMFIAYQSIRQPQSIDEITDDKSSDSAKEYSQDA